MRKGAAKLSPINGKSKYMQSPNAEIVAIAADKLPRRPINGLLLTASLFIQVITEKIPINKNVLVKYGVIVLVFSSSSDASVLDANLATLMCLKRSSFSALPMTFRKASSQAKPLSMKLI